MNLFHIVVIGSNEAALVCAITSKKYYCNKNVALIINNQKNKFLNQLFRSARMGRDYNDIHVISSDIIKRMDNLLYLENGEIIAFEKLVIATGSEAIRPDIEGIEKEGVHFITKDPDHLHSIKNAALNADNIILYGGGYVGVLLADELLQAGKRATIIARTNRLLPSSFDPEVSEEAKKLIAAAGGKIIFKSKVKQVLGNKSISGIRLRNGEKIPCDFLIVCCGEKPNTDLAAKFGLVFDSDRGILVDEYQRTSDRNIFAIGECAARFDFFCGDLSDFLLSATRMEEAKLIGSNLYSIIYNRGRLIDYFTEKEKIRKDIGNLLSLSLQQSEESFINQNQN